MDGLMSFQAQSVRAVSREQSSVPLPIFSPKITRVSVRPIGMVRKSKLFNSFVASVQPVEASAVTPFDNTLPSKEVLAVWQNVNAVCFDVDSTVCIDEGIDEFAEFCGAGKAVAEWTARAMNGSVSFEDALAARLSLINPSLSQLQDFLKRPPRLSPGIDLLVKKLKDKKKDVYLVSGGFRQMINPVASILGITLENIFANQMLFGSNGEFAGFDKNEPTSRSGGKPTAVQQIKKAHGYKSVVMIGDGATDLEARMPGGADLFICYGGVQLRESVAAKADWLVFNFKDLINSLENWELTAPFSGCKIQVTTRFVVGDLDATYHVPGTKEYILNGGFKIEVPNLQEVVVMEEVGHFINQEKPDEINARIYDFIQRF